MIQKIIRKVIKQIKTAKQAYLCKMREIRRLQ